MSKSLRCKGKGKRSIAVSNLLAATGTHVHAVWYLAVLPATWQR